MNSFLIKKELILIKIFEPREVTLNNFAINLGNESQPSTEMINRVTGIVDQRRRPMMLIVSAQKGWNKPALIYIHDPHNGMVGF